MLLASLTTLAGCGTEGTVGTAPSWSSLPQLSLETQAELGGYEAQGPAALGAVSAAALVPGSGQFAVADGLTQEVHYFTRSGRHVRTVGGRGGGPGEFRAIRVLKGLRGGDVCAWDIQDNRVTIFDSIGDLKAAARANLDEVQAIFPSLVGFMDRCSFVLLDQVGEMNLGDQPEGIRRDSVTFLLFDASGSQLRRLAKVPDTDQWLSDRNGVWGRVELVFGEQLIAFVSGSHLWLGHSGNLHWLRIDPSTGGADSLEIPLRGRVASTEDIKAERTRRLDAIAPRPKGVLFADGVDQATVFATAESAAIRAVPARDHIPAYDDIVAGWDGAIWLREYPEPAAVDARWVLMSTEEGVLGQILLPRTTKILDADFEWMITSDTDDLDAPVIRILRRIE